MQIGIKINRVQTLLMQVSNPALPTFDREAHPANAVIDGLKYTGSAGSPRGEKVEHYKLPWKAGISTEGQHGIVDSEDTLIADVSTEEHSDFIVKACNCHDELLELAQEIAKEYEDAADWKDAIGKLQRMANAAIAKAESCT